MPAIRFLPIATDRARAYTEGGLDAYGRAPERSICEGAGNPCRHCLQDIAKGAAILTTSPDYLLKGYTQDARIRYGTGKVIAQSEITTYASELLQRREVAFVDVRSARNNCFQLRIIRA